MNEDEDFAIRSAHIWSLANAFGNEEVTKIDDNALKLLNPQVQIAPQVQVPNVNNTINTLVEIDNTNPNPLPMPTEGDSDEERIVYVRPTKKARTETIPSVVESITPSMLLEQKNTALLAAMPPDNRSELDKEIRSVRRGGGWANSNDPRFAIPDIRIIRKNLQLAKVDSIVSDENDPSQAKFARLPLRMHLLMTKNTQDLTQKEDQFLGDKIDQYQSIKRTKNGKDTMIKTLKKQLEDHLEAAAQHPDATFHPDEDSEEEKIREAFAEKRDARSLKILFKLKNMYDTEDEFREKGGALRLYPGYSRYDYYANLNRVAAKSTVVEEGNHRIWTESTNERLEFVERIRDTIQAAEAQASLEKQAKGRKKTFKLLREFKSLFKNKKEFEKDKELYTSDPNFYDLLRELPSHFNNEIVFHRRLLASLVEHLQGNTKKLFFPDPVVEAKRSQARLFDYKIPVKHYQRGENGVMITFPEGPKVFPNAQVVTRHPEHPNINKDSV